MQSAVSVSANMPEKKYLPNQAGHIEGTRYIFMQTGGGSILLGPIFGSMNVSRLSQEMAKQYKDSVIQVDPLPASTAALEAAGIKASGEAAAFNLKPFVFVQRCDDEIQAGPGLPCRQRQHQVDWPLHLPSAIGIHR